jgi:hypothetical protein
MEVCLLCLYVVLSCVGRGLYDGLITCPEESYRVSCMCDHRNHKRGPMFQVGNERKMNECMTINNKLYLSIYQFYQVVPTNIIVTARKEVFNIHLTLTTNIYEGEMPFSLSYSVGANCYARSCQVSGTGTGFYPSSSVSPANIIPPLLSILIYHLGVEQ